MAVMNAEQRRRWAEAVVRHEPPRMLYAGLTFQEANLRAASLTQAAMQLGCWTHLPNHLALIHVEMLKRSKS